MPIMSDLEKCPICLDTEFEKSDDDTLGVTKYKCMICGNFDISRTTKNSVLDEKLHTLSEIERASIAYGIRKVNKNSGEIVISAEVLDEMIENTVLFSPAIQIKNLIQYFGDEFRKNGLPIYNIPDNLHAIVGSPNFEFVISLIRQLRELNIVIYDDSNWIENIFLTVNGWNLYESNKHSVSDSKFGFIAMQYGDTILENIVRDHIKPRVESELGYKIRILREELEAGIIDNIMRERIRESAIVLADLSEDNFGAYWEAGYAEGLGIPVIYLCNEEKFNEVKTHFDTNHSTTVLWTHGKEPEFCDALIATIKKSLKLYDLVSGFDFLYSK